MIIRQIFGQACSIAILGCIYGYCFNLLADPATSSVPFQPNAGELYTIKAGETLREIARRKLGGEEFMLELLEYNHIENPLVVSEGYLIMIPGKEMYI